MKRGSLFAAALVLIGGTLRIVGYGAAAPVPRGNEPRQHESNVNTAKNVPQTPYFAKFAGTIREFYGVKDSSSGGNLSLASYFKTLQRSWALWALRTASQCNSSSLFFLTRCTRIWDSSSTAARKPFSKLRR